VNIGQKDELCPLKRRRELRPEVGKNIEFQFHGRSLIGVMTVESFPVEGLPFGKLQSLKIDFSFLEKIDGFLGKILAYDPDNLWGGEIAGSKGTIRTGSSDDFFLALLGSFDSIEG
jgi:hypothetical protein